MDNAVTSLTNAGIHVAVAAGNSNVNAANTSPARAPSAVTVGASTIGDAKASFSNFGAVVDIFAPGQSIISSWIGSNTVSILDTSSSTETDHGISVGYQQHLRNLHGKFHDDVIA